MKNVSIFVKILSLSVIIALLFLLIVLFWILPTIKSGLFEERLASMKAPVEMVYNYLDSIQARVETNEITKEQGIRDILRNISSLRYDGGKNYVWVNDESSVMLWHPNPKLINVNMSDRADKNGVR